MVRATCSHNGPLYTDKVSKWARRRTRKGFGGSELCGIDSVKTLSKLGDVGWREYRGVGETEGRSVGAQDLKVLNR